MDAGPQGPPLVPAEQPVDLIVSVTDFAGHKEQLTLNSLPRVTEQEHRLMMHFRHNGRAGKRLDDVPGLVRRGARDRELSGCLSALHLARTRHRARKARRRMAGRDAFIRAQLPRVPDSDPADRVLIDGAVLANAPFRPAIAALKQRPARREIDRRFIYIDPKPDYRRSASANPAR